MAKRAATTSSEDRMAIIEYSQKGFTASQIADELHLSIPTVHKWRQRYRRDGWDGLVSRTGRPSDGALSSFSAEVRRGICQLRKSHPGWGPITLRCELAKFVSPGSKLPSRARIAEFLKQEQLVPIREPRSELPVSPTSELDHCHQE